MEIPKDLLENWKKLRSSSDVKEMMEKKPGSNYQLFNRAFRDGKCSNEVFKIMSKFYSNKSALISKAVNSISDGRIMP